MYEHKPFIKQLTGHTSEETAFVVDDYPYGFKLRTMIRFWIESTKAGQRAVSQTKNPKNGWWNTPKKSTYSPIKVMGIDEKGHVIFDGIGVYASLEEARNFNACFALDPVQQKFIGALIGAGEVIEKRDAEREAKSPAS
jgi:hypothetical protein